MRRIDFYKLTREKQERFLASTKASAPPAPIVQLSGDGGRTVRWAATSGGALVALLVVYILRYGVLGAPMAVHGVLYLVVYAGLVFLIPYAALRAFGSFRAGKLLPYKLGIYVFPMCLVDAREKVLRIHAMTDLGTVGKAAAGGALKLSFRGGGSFSFPAGDVHNAEALNRNLENAQAQVKHALATSDDSELTTLDPFYDAKKGWTSPIGPKEPMVDRAPAWRKFDWAMALGCALIIAPTLWFVHNKSSDDSMLKKATAIGTPEAYKSYLEVGKRHHDEVAATLLPRAELDRAKAEQSVEAIQAFIASHPESAIGQEAQDALREAMLRELDKAKKGASLASLAAFEKKYPEHHLTRELIIAKHELYVAAIARFKTMAASDDPQLLAFVSRLAKFLESHGPMITIVFRREVSPALAQADKFMSGTPANRAFGPRQVTKYFDPTADQPKEVEVVNAFKAAMLRVFGPDLFDAKMGADVPDDAAQAALASKEALIVVRYRFGWLGNAYGSIQYKRAFAGIHVSGEATCSIPDAGVNKTIRIEIPPAHGLPLSYTATHEGLSAPPANDEKPEADIYAAQDLRALDHIATILENSFLKSAAKEK